LKRYTAGDESLVDEIQANAQSSAPIAQLAREGTAKKTTEKNVENGKRKRELENEKFRDMRADVRAKELALVSTFVNTMTTLNPNWKENTQLRMQTEDWLKSIVINNTTPTTTDVNQQREKNMVGGVAVAADAIVAPPMPCISIDSDLSDCSSTTTTTNTTASTVANDEPSPPIMHSIGVKNNTNMTLQQQQQQQQHFFKKFNNNNNNNNNNVIISRFFSALTNGACSESTGATALYRKYAEFHTLGNYKFLHTENAFGRDVKRIVGVDKRRTSSGMVYRLDFAKIKQHLIDINEYDAESSLN